MKDVYYTREQCEQQLDAWLKANLAVSQGQKYMIGSRSLTRVNATEILNQIKFWKDQLNKLDLLENQKGTNRIFRAIPRD